MTKNENSYLDNEIKRLLKDTWSFLDKEIKNGYMTLESTLIANHLIQRCKLYTEEVDTCMQTTEESESCNTSYVDMQAKTNKVPDEYVETDVKFKEEPEDCETVYHDPSLNISKSENNSDSSIMEDEHTYRLYANLPATQLNMNEKFGHLIRREKFLFIEQHKKIYAAVQESFFLLYSSEKDAKPFRTLDLNQYQAKTQEYHGKDHKKKRACFELTNIHGKSYQFVAPSEEEAMEWLIAINRKRTKSMGETFKTATVVHKRILPPLPNTNKDSCDNNMYETVDHDVDYSEIDSKEGCSKKDEKKLKEVPIPLPPRIPEGVLFKSPLTSPKKGTENHRPEEDKPAFDSDRMSSSYDFVSPFESCDGFYDFPKQAGMSIAKNGGDIYDIVKSPDAVSTFKEVIDTLTEELKLKLHRNMEEEDTEEGQDSNMEHEENGTKRIDGGATSKIDEKKSKTNESMTIKDKQKNEGKEKSKCTITVDEDNVEEKKKEENNNDEEKNNEEEKQQEKESKEETKPKVETVNEGKNNRSDTDLTTANYKQDTKIKNDCEILKNGKIDEGKIDVAGSSCANKINVEDIEMKSEENEEDEDNGQNNIKTLRIDDEKKHKYKKKFEYKNVEEKLQTAFLKPSTHSKPKFFALRCKKVVRPALPTRDENLEENTGRVSNLVNQFTRKQKCHGVELSSSDC